MLYPQMQRITIIVSNTKRADDDETESITLLQFTTMDPIQNNFVKMISTPIFEYLVSIMHVAKFNSNLIRHK